MAPTLRRGWQVEQRARQLHVWTARQIRTEDFVAGDVGFARPSATTSEIGVTVVAMDTAGAGRRRSSKRNGSSAGSGTAPNVAFVAAREVAAAREVVLATDRRRSRAARLTRDVHSSGVCVELLARASRRSRGVAARRGSPLARTDASREPGRARRGTRLCCRRRRVRSPRSRPPCTWPNVTDAAERRIARAAERVDRGVAVRGQLGQPGDVCRRDAPPAATSTQVTAGASTIWPSTRDEWKPSPAAPRPVAERLIPGPEVDARSGRLVGVDARRAERSPSPRPHGAELHVGRDLLRSERLPLDHSQPGLAGLQTLASARRPDRRPSGSPRTIPSRSGAMPMLRKSAIVERMPSRMRRLPRSEPRATAALRVVVGLVDDRSALCRSATTTRRRHRRRSGCRSTKSTGRAPCAASPCIRASTFARYCAFVADHGVGECGAEELVERDPRRRAGGRGGGLAYSASAAAGIDAGSAGFAGWPTMPGRWSTKYVVAAPWARKYFGTAVPARRDDDARAGEDRAGCRP